MKTLEWIIAGSIFAFVVSEVIRNWSGFTGGAL